MRMIRGKFWAYTWLIGFLGVFYSVPVLALESGSSVDNTQLFLWLGVMLIGAKLFSFSEKVGIPGVLGELLSGVLLSFLAFVGVSQFQGMGQHPTITFLAELGAVILLFQVGLESQVKELVQVGFSAVRTAVAGILVTFAVGLGIIVPWLFPDLPFFAGLFLVASLAATSVGITARVFRELGWLGSKEAKIVLGAAVIDDILSLILLAVVSGVAQKGSLELWPVVNILLNTALFILFSVVLGQLLAPFLSRVFARISTGVGMKFTLAICFGLLSAYFAHLLGLAPLIGAFAAGLMLDSVHFKYFKDAEVIAEVKKSLQTCSPEDQAKVWQAVEPHAMKQIEEIIEPVALFLVPLFFVHTGMQVDLSLLADPKLVLTAMGVTVLAFLAKFASGMFHGKGVNKTLIGLGMTPKGEVSIIFASLGLSYQVLSPELFSVIILTVVGTTVITPILLSLAVKCETNPGWVANPWNRLSRKLASMPFFWG